MRKCVICGTTRVENGVCINVCHWIIPGWVGYNALKQSIKFFDTRALGLTRLHGWDPKTRRKTVPTFNRLMKTAHGLGWQENIADPSATFVE